MSFVRGSVSLLLLFLVALVGGAFGTLLAQGRATPEIGLSVLVLLVALALAIARGIQARRRPETPYW